MKSSRRSTAGAIRTRLGSSVAAALAARLPFPAAAGGVGGRWTLPINLALYQVGWFACVLGAASGRVWEGAALAVALTAVHLLLVLDRAREAALILSAGALGLVLDSIQLRLGVFQFPSGTPLAGVAPPWIVVLWLQFATLLHFALGWLSGRYRLAAALGFLGGPLSFMTGERLGAIDFPSPWSYGILACVWGIAFPFLVWVADGLRPRPAGYR